MKSELIIFDCDGTLADSETLHQQAVIGALETCGFSGYDVAFCMANFVGRGMSYVQKIIEEREGREVPPEFIPLYVDLCSELMRKSLKPLPYAVEAVEELMRDYKICVASNGEPDNVVKAIDAIGLMPLFGRERIFTKSQVARGKPAPDLFLFAADKMGVSPERSIVVEDSVAGVTAGLAAGMLTIGITGTNHDPEQIRRDMKNAGVVHILDSWPEITKFIQAL
jgi:HAD superfamily hydrolase (TIGR01509 family)